MDCARELPICLPGLYTEPAVKSLCFWHLRLGETNPVCCVRTAERHAHQDRFSMRVGEGYTVVELYVIVINVIFFFV